MALPVQADTALRGMETGEDFRLGPVIQAGFPLGLSQTGDRQLYQLELRGESPNHGYSRLSLRVITLYEMLELPRLNNTSGTEIIDHRVRFHHQFLNLGLASPLFYELTRDLQFEGGWTAGFSLAQVNFTQPTASAASNPLESLLGNYPKVDPTSLGARQKTNPAQADAQFAGGEFGGYMRYYGWYPFVPYAGAAFQIGSFLDLDGLIKGVEETPSLGTTPTPTPSASTAPTRQRVYQSGFRLGPTVNLGIETYLGSRGVLGVEYRLWNWDLGRSQDWTHFISLKAGFLF